MIVRRATLADIAAVRPRHLADRAAQAWLIEHPEAVEQAVLPQAWAAEDADGAILCVAGIVEDGGTWTLLDERVAERPAAARAIFRASREICTRYWRDTGILPYSEPDPEIPEAPRVARALGFVDTGAEKWGLRLPS